MLITKVCQKCGKSFEADPWADDLNVCRECLGEDHTQEDESADAVVVELDANRKTGSKESMISDTQARDQPTNDHDSSESKAHRSTANGSMGKSPRLGKEHSRSRTVFDNTARSKASHWWQAGQRRRILGVIDILASLIVVLGSFVLSFIMFITSLKDGSFFPLPISASLFAAGLLYLRSIAPLKQIHFETTANNSDLKTGGTIRRALHSCSNILERLLHVRAIRIIMLILRTIAAACAACLIIAWLWVPAEASAWLLLLPCYFCVTSFREIGVTVSKWRKRREWVIASPGSRAIRYVMVIATAFCSLLLTQLHASRLSSRQDERMMAEPGKREQMAAEPSGVSSRGRGGSLDTALKQAKKNYLKLNEQFDELYSAYREKETHELAERIERKKQEISQKAQEISDLKKDIRRERMELKLAEYSKKRQSWVKTIPSTGKPSTNGSNGLFDDTLSRLENNQKVGEELFALMADYPSNVIRMTKPDKPEYDNSKGNVVLDVEFAVDHARYDSFIKRLSSFLTQRCGEPAIVYINDNLYDDIDNDGIAATPEELMSLRQKSRRAEVAAEIEGIQHVGLHDFVRQNAKTNNRRILLCTMVDKDKRGAYWEVYTVHQDVADVFDGKMETPVLAAELYDSKRRVMGCDFFTMYTPLEIHSNRRSVSPHLRINTKSQPTLLELDKGLIFTCFPSFHSSDLTQDIVRHQVTVPFDIKELDKVREIKVHYRVPFKLVGLRRRIPKVEEWIYITGRDQWNKDGGKLLYVVTAVDGPEQDPVVTYTRTFAPTRSAPGAHQTYKNRLSEISLISPGDKFVVWPWYLDDGLTAAIAIPAPVAEKDQLVDGTVIYYKDGGRIELSDSIPFIGLSYAISKHQSFQLYDCGFNNPPDILKN